MITAGIDMGAKNIRVVIIEGNKIIGWWKDWREPFIANYTF